MAAALAGTAVWRHNVEERRKGEEARAQVQKILAAGIRPSHIDTHKHTHLLPPVLDVVARIAREFDIPWVRRPFDFGIGSQTRLLKGAVAFGMRVLAPRFATVLKGLRTTDHFTGFQITGTLDQRSLAETLQKLPP